MTTRHPHQGPGACSGVHTSMKSMASIYGSHWWSNWPWHQSIVLPTLQYLKMLMESQRLEEDRLRLGAVDFYSSQTMLAVIYHSMSAYKCMHLFTVCIHVYCIYCKPARFLEDNGWSFNSFSDPLVLLALGRPNAFCVATSGETGAWAHIHIIYM